MSFTVKQKLNTTVSYGNIVSDVPAEFTEIDVVYSIISVSLNQNAATASYTAMINGATSDLIKFSFEYSGSGNPLVEAETALQSYFESKDTATS